MHASRTCLLPLLTLLGAVALGGGCGGDHAPTPAVDAEASAAIKARYEAARDQVLPSEAERRWEEIDWQPTYAGGLRASSDQQKPLLLWVMNGHPLGCT
ncbi:MAG: hypothetical protein P1V36_02780 [Planctomycetota bacterium]|nr:hypothetical protein [Planctomycetota bacterium]